MTAFARCDLESPWGNAQWELRSVNNRYLEVSPKLPEELRRIEQSVRERIRGCLNRGKVDCLLRVNHHGADGAPFAIDTALARRVIDAGREVGAMLAAAGEMSQNDVLRWPGVVQPAPVDLDAIGAGVMALLDRALVELVATREREGARIHELVEQRLTTIGEIVARVRARLPDVLAASRARLENRLADLLGQLDSDRVEQEMVMMAQKLDVDEELDRIEAHVDEVRRVLAADEPAGRRLDFLMQELNREANTLGSKSADVATTQASVDLKVCIEQMREQIQNVE